MSVRPNWIGVDWGTTNLRVWALGAGDAVLAEATSDRGMNQLAPGEFGPALLALIGGWDWQDVPIIACGMVGAKQGWVEAPYAHVPSPPLNTASAVTARGAGLSVTIMPGLCQHDPADVMRGEETQIAGFLAQDRDFFGLLCLPGTHTKWVHIQNRRVTQFRTYLTGEMFALLARQSILRHSMDETWDGAWDEAIFAASLREALDNPAAATGTLFSLRAAGLVGRASPAAKAALSGRLIGVELAHIRPLLAEKSLRIIGSGQMASAYQNALALIGQTAPIIPETGLTLAGLAMAQRALAKEQT